MAEAQFKSGRRQLPPPRYKDDKDTRNVIVKTMQQSKPKKAADILVADPQNSDLTGSTPRCQSGCRA